MNEEVKLDEVKPEFPASVEIKKEKQSSAKEQPKPTKLQIDVLQYFSNLPTNRQVSLIEENDVDFVKLAEAVANHRKAALEEDEIAIEKMLADQAPNKSGEKSALLETRYKASIERFAKRGLTPAMISKHLTEVERGNYPKRGKNWRFTPAIIGKFMKDNGIEVNKI